MGGKFVKFKKSEKTANNLAKITLLTNPYGQ